MAKPATLNDLMTPMKSIEACLQEQSSSFVEGVSSINDTINELNRDVTFMLRGIARRMRELERNGRNAKANATNTAIKPATTAPKEQKSSLGKTLGDMKAVGEMFSPQNLASGVKAFSEIKMKHFLQFPRKMSYAANGMLQPILELRNNMLTPQKAIQYAKAFTAIGDAAESFMKDMSKTFLTAKLIEKFTPKDVYKSGIFKATEQVVTAILVNIYGKKYNKQSRTFTGGDPKRILQLKQGATVMNKMANSLVKFMGFAALTAILAPVALIGVALSALVIQMTTIVFKHLGDKKQKRDIENGHRVLNGMGASLIMFEVSLVMAAIFAPFALIALGMVAPVVLGTMLIFKKLGSKNNTNNVKRASITIMLMGASLVVFSLSLYLSAMIVKQFFVGSKEDVKDNMYGLAMTIPVFALMMGALWVFKRVGTSNNMKSSMKALVAIAAISVGLIIFSAALYISNMMTKDMWKNENGELDPVAMITTVAVFGLLVGSIYAFKLAGTQLASIAKGMVAVILMGVGLAVFGFGAGFYMNLIKDNSWKDVGKAAALIGIFGVEFILLGIPVVFGFVALGSASVALMAVALGVFGFGVAVYMKCIEDISWEQVGQGAGILGVYGLEFALLGLMSPAILGADLAIACMGPALSTFASGLKPFTEIIEDVDIDTVIKGAGIMGVFGLEFAGLGLISIAILAADAAIACMGGAMFLFSKGLKPFAEVFEETNPKTLIEGAGILGILAAEFAAIGVVSLLIAPAAGSIALMGESLVSLGKGLSRWMDAGVGRDDIDDLCYAIDRIKLIFIGQKDGDKDKGFFGKIGSAISGALAAPFDTANIAATALGLKIAGNAVGDLAVGLQKWIDADIRVEDMANMTTIIGTIGETFQRLGEKKQNGNNEGSLLRRLIGIDFRGLTKTDMELGIRSVQGLGKALEEIASGLVKWRDTMGKEFEGDKLIQFANQIAAVVGALGTAFASIASDENTVLLETTNTSSFANAMGETFGSFTKQEYKNRVQMGIESVKGLGTELVGIADGMEKMTKIAVEKLGTMPTIDMKTWTVSDGSGAMKATAEVLLAMGQVFSKIGEEIQKQGMYEEVIEPAHDVLLNDHWYGDTTGHVDAKIEHKSYIGLAVSSLMGIGDIVSGIANALNTMSQIKNTGNLDATYDTLLQVVEKTIATFTRIGDEIEGKHTGTATVMVGKTAIQMPKNDTKSFLENVGLIVKMTKDAKDVMVALPEMVKTLNKNKGEFEKFVNDSDDTLFCALSNVFTVISAMSGAAQEEGEVGSRLLYNWYDEKGNTVGKAFTWLNKKAMKNAKTNADNIASFFESVGVALGKLPKEKVNTEILQEAIVGAGTDVMYMNAWLNEDEIATAKSNVEKMDELIVSANTMLGKVPLELKLLGDLREGNENGALMFNDLFHSISNSIHNLDSQKDRIDKTTNLIQTLSKAKKDGVFSDLSNNIDKVVQTINSLDSEKLKPYADMITALRDMSSENSKFKEMFEELIKTLSKLIEEIKNGGTEGLTGEGGSENRNTDNVQTAVVNNNGGGNTAALTDLSKKIGDLVGSMRKGDITVEKPDGTRYMLTFKG